jgi:hypothetical protein
MRTLLLALLMVAGSAGTALAKQHRYVGEHPVGGGGFCHINAAHVHVASPVKAEVLFRNHDGWAHFVGDPVAYGYAGPKFAYAGPHPVHVDVIIGETEVDGDEIEYCYLRGPHYHLSAPPPDAHFQLEGGAYWYVEALPPEFTAAKPRLAVINAVYEPMVYVRPVVTVAPPRGWIDVYVAAPTVRAGVVVEAASVPPPSPEQMAIGVGLSVQLPMPVIGVHVGAGPVVVHEPPRRSPPPGVWVRAKPARPAVKVHGHGKVKIKGRF